MNTLFYTQANANANVKYLFPWANQTLTPFPPVCMYKEPSLHELEEKLLKSSRSPTLNSGDRERSRKAVMEEPQEDCTEPEAS